MAKRKPAPLPTHIPASANERMKPDKADTMLIGPVQRMLLRNRPQESVEWRGDGLHPSELSKESFCPRQAVYRATGVAMTEPSVEEFSPETLLIFAEGHNIHDKWQNWWWDLGVLEGEFLCLNCDYRWWATAPEVCPDCTTQERWGIRYLEVPLRSEALCITSHADALVRGVIVEIKSVGAGTVRALHPQLYARYAAKEITHEQLWSEIHKPFPEHLRQAMFYAWLHGVEDVRFLYEWKSTSQPKEFAVKLRMRTIQPMIDKAQSVVDALISDVVPDRPWTENSATACQQCPYRSHCWRPRRKEITRATPQTSTDETPPPGAVARRRRTPEAPRA